MDPLSDLDEEKPAQERAIRVDVYHHFPEGLPELRVSVIDVIDVDVDLSGEVTVKAAVPTPVPSSIHLVPGKPVIIRTKEQPQHG